ncbi:MAG: NAD-dependent epimerase/dehydratase family protein [Pseudomonadota bacterium]
MKHVFLTGGSGFLGHHIAARFIAAGWEVGALVRETSDTAGLQDLGAVLIRGRLDGGHGIAEAMRGCQAVVHCAGSIASNTGDEYLRVNRDGAGAIAGAAVAAGVPRFVLISSIAAHGPSMDGGDGVDRPISAYGRSKLAGEVVVREILGDRTALAILRPPPIYGPRDRALVPVFKLARRGLMPTYGREAGRFSIVSGEDAADAVFRLASMDVPPGPYYPEDGARPTWPGFAAAFSEALDRPVRALPLPRPLFWVAGAGASLWGRITHPQPFTIDKVREMAAPGWVFSARRLREATGWEARTELVQGLRETLAWYLEKGWI